MKKQFLLLACLAGITLFVSSCGMNIVTGKGNSVTNTRTASTFNAVDISAPVNATIVVMEGSQPSIQFTGYENLINIIRTKVEDNTLKIYMDDGFSVNTDKDVVVHITMPSITALDMSGSQETKVEGNVTGSEFSADMSGAGKLIMDNVNVGHLSMDLSGTGNIEIKGGIVKAAEYDLSGAGTLKAFGLQTETTEASLSGVGTSEVSASQKLNADISGAGTIKYKGHPQVTSDISGVGTVSDAN